MSTNFVGIDLGTTNSAIVSYNGTETETVQNSVSKLNLPIDYII